MNRRDTVLFDLDGTLLDTLGDLRESVNAALASWGYPPRTQEEIRSFVGNGIGTMMARAMPGGRDNPDFERCLTEFRAYYTAHMNVHTAPYPGMTELVERLAAAGVKLAVVSNKFQKGAETLVGTHFGIAIPVVLGEIEGLRPKPHPDTVLEALRRLSSDASRAVFVGDSAVDVATARNTGLPCAAVTWGFASENALREAGAEHFCRNARELEDFLRSIL